MHKKLKASTLTRVLCAVLCLVMLIGLLPMTLFAEAAEVVEPSAEPTTTVKTQADVDENVKDDNTPVDPESSPENESEDDKDDNEIGSDSSRLFDWDDGWNELDKWRQDILRTCISLEIGHPYDFYGKCEEKGLPVKGALSCATFTKWVYWTALDVKLSDGTKDQTSLDVENGLIQEITKEELLPGDLGFKFIGGSKIEDGIYNHTGIYAGNDEWFHERQSEGGFCKTKLDEFTVFFRVNPELIKEESSEETPAPTVIPSAEPVEADDEKIASDASVVVAGDDLMAATVQGEASQSKFKAKAALKSMANVQNNDSLKTLTNALFSAPPATDGTLPLDDLPSQYMGTSIDALSVRWMTRDTNEDNNEALLSIAPADDKKFTVKYRMNYALSGERDYMPGDITITVPAHVFTNRFNSTEGKVIIPYGEAPSKKNDYNWAQVGDSYVITNTKRMAAATKGFIEFAIINLTPSNLIDMSTSSPINVELRVTTSTGEEIGLKTTDIACQVDTDALITGMIAVQHNEKNNSDLNVMNIRSASSIPESQRIEGEKYYVVINWYGRSTYKANTPFNDERTFAIPNELNGFIIGATSADGRTKTVTRHFKTWDPATNTYEYENIQTAYPLSSLTPNVVYTFHLNANYTVTEDDLQTRVTAKTSSASFSGKWRQPRFDSADGTLGHYSHGNDNVPYDSTNLANRLTCLYSDGKYSDAYIGNYLYDPHGEYPSALNRLRQGEDINVSFVMSSLGYLFPHTYVAENSAESERKLANYGKRTIEMLATDNFYAINSDANKLTPTVDYEYVSVRLASPIVRKAVPQNMDTDGNFIDLSEGDSTFTYINDNDRTHIPTVSLEIKRNNTWEPWATADWTSGSLIVTFADGRTQTSATIPVPANTQSYRTRLQSNAAVVWYESRPVLKIKSTSAMQSRIESLFAQSNTPYFYLQNDNMTQFSYCDTSAELATLGASKDNTLGHNYLTGYGYDALRGYSTDIEASAIASSWQNLSEVDFDNRQLTVHYSASASMRSMVGDEEAYKQAVSDGTIAADTHCTWYDLLPKGVTPILNSISVTGNTPQTPRTKDKITNVYTIENYKNSGRILLVVEADLVPVAEKVFSQRVLYFKDEPQIKFAALQTLESLKDYGLRTHNVIAYESDSTALGTIDGYKGEPDNPNSGNNFGSQNAFENDQEKSLMTDLNSSHNNPVFLYAGTYTNLDSLSAGSTSLLKDAQVNYDGNWLTGTHGEDLRAYAGSIYQYRLRAVSDIDTISKDLIFYESLENYMPTEHETECDLTNNVCSPNCDVSNSSRWQGTLTQVDVSQLIQRGCAPVIYYSTVPNLTFVDDPEATIAVANANINLADTTIWTRADQYTGELANVKAIAVDASKKADGTDFQIDPLDSIALFINMRAPSGTAIDDLVDANAHAFDNSYLKCTSIDQSTGGLSSDNFIHKDYTKVGLLPFNYTVNVTWADDDDRDGIRPESVTLHIYANEQDTGKTVTVSKNNDWSEIIDDILFFNSNGEKAIYSLAPDDVDGYTIDVKLGQNNDFAVKLVHEPELINLSGEKTWANDNGVTRPDNIMVQLLKDGVLNSTKMVYADDQGNWKYTFNKLYKYRDHGTEIAYTIKEQAKANNSAWIPSYDGINILNTYHPKGTLNATLKSLNITPVSAQAEFPVTFKFFNGEAPVFDTFEYSIMGDIIGDGEWQEISSGTVSTNSTVNLKAEQTIVVKEIPMETTYEITEETPDGFTISKWSALTGTIQPNATAKAEITNTYSADGTVNLIAEKVLNNRTLKNNQFKFELKGENDNLLRTAFSSKPKETTNRDNGTVEYSKADVTFGALRYTQAEHGKTYTYTISEVNANKAGYTYDNIVYEAKIYIVDNGNGTLTITPTYYKPATLPDEEDSTSDEERNTISVPIFTNTYSATGSVDLKAWVTLSGGREIQDGEFSFELKDPEDNVIQTKTNDANKEIIWDSLNYTEQDVGLVKTYYAEEVTGNDNTVNYDTRKVKYEVEIVDNGDGTLGFTTSFYMNDGTDDSEYVEATPVFNNTLKDGSLVVRKAIDPDSEEYDPDQLFTFRLELNNPQGDSVEVDMDNVRVTQYEPMTINIIDHYRVNEADTDYIEAGSREIVANKLDGIPLLMLTSSEFAIKYSIPDNYFPYYFTINNDTTQHSDGESVELNDGDIVHCYYAPPYHITAYFIEDGHVESATVKSAVVKPGENYVPNYDFGGTNSLCLSGGNYWGNTPVPYSWFENYNWPFGFGKIKYTK